MRSDSNKLTAIYKAIAILIFAILTFRFAQLQVYDWDKYFRESERNRVREVILEPPRGVLYDRYGTALVDNRPAYSVSVIPYEVFKSDSTVELLSSILKYESEAMKQQIRKDRIGNFAPVKVKRQVDFNILSNIEEYCLDLPGVLYNLEAKRFYPAGVNAPHIFGYLGEITTEELEFWQENGYRKGDLIGKNGLELQYESYLRGKPGIKYVEVDVLGREVRDLPELSYEPVEPGKNIYLTYDAEIQRYLEQAMTDKQGAAIVLDPRNGEVLAILSKPDYDPETFSKPLTPEVWDGLVNDPGRPLYNRACQSLFPPGSTYKLVLAAALLESGDFDLDKEVHCTGSYRFGRRTFNCWKRTGHGSVNFIQSIEQSCNVYFWSNVLDAGLARWSRFSRLLRFGRLTGIDLPEENAGLVPDADYFDRKYGENGWTNGLLLNLAVGQGDLLTTPLQMAYFAMVLANEGTAYQPHIFKSYADEDQNDLSVPRFEKVQISEISRQTFQKIKEGMYEVVNGSNGTAKSCRLPGIRVCGKTGTAQNPHGKDHAWFIGFAPMENPEIAWCVMVENGGGGGAVAAPIAAGVLSLYFKDRQVALQQ